MNILCTGAHGFVGTHVLKRLTTHEITCLDSLESQVHGFPGLDRKDLRSGEYDKISDGNYDVVIHLAAKVGVGQSMYDPVDYVACNSLDTAKLLANLTKRPPKRLVVASSMSVYGEGATACGGVMLKKREWSVPTPETHPPDLRSIYALTKFDQEQLALIWGRAHNVPTVALRFFNIYGPGQALTNPYTGVLAIFATRLLNDKPPIIYGDGQQTRDFVHVSDVAAAVEMAAAGRLDPGVYNVGSGVPRTVESVARDLAKALGVDIAPVITHKERAGDIRHCYADITKLTTFGWKPRMRWEDGLRDYVDWLRAQPLPEDRFDAAEAELVAAGLLQKD